MVQQGVSHLESRCVISKTKIMVYGVAITEFFLAMLLQLLLASAFRQCLGFILKEKLMMQLLSL